MTARVRRVQASNQRLSLENQNPVPQGPSPPNSLPIHTLDTVCAQRYHSDIASVQIIFVIVELLYLDSLTLAWQYLRERSHAQALQLF